MTSRKTLHDAVLDMGQDLCFGRCENILSRVLQPARRCATIRLSSLPTNLEMNMTNAKNATATVKPIAELQVDLAAARRAEWDARDALAAAWDAWLAARPELEALEAARAAEDAWVAAREALEAAREALEAARAAREKARWEVQS